MKKPRQGQQHIKLAPGGVPIEARHISQQFVDSIRTVQSRLDESCLDLAKQLNKAIHPDPLKEALLKFLLSKRYKIAELSVEVPVIEETETVHCVKVARLKVLRSDPPCFELKLDDKIIVSAI